MAIASPPLRRCVNGADPDGRFEPRGGVGEFWEAPDLKKIGEALIEKKFPDFPECVVDYVWKVHASTGGGKLTIGKCIKQSGLGEFYSRADYVLWFAFDRVVAGFTNWQMEALVYHELCHIAEEGDEGKKKLTTKAHDVEAFESEIAEYGFWKSDVRSMARVIQARLAFEDTADPDPLPDPFGSDELSDPDDLALPSMEQVMEAANQHMSEDEEEEAP